MFEKIIIKQIPYLLDLFLSKCQCRSRKGFSAQNCLLAMFEKWKSSVNKGKTFYVLFPELLKVFVNRIKNHRKNKCLWI